MKVVFTYSKNGQTINEVLEEDDSGFLFMPQWLFKELSRTYPLVLTEDGGVYTFACRCFLSHQPYPIVRFQRDAIALISFLDRHFWRKFWAITAILGIANRSAGKMVEWEDLKLGWLIELFLGKQPAESEKIAFTSISTTPPTALVGLGISDSDDASQKAKNAKNAKTNEIIRRMLRDYLR